MTIYIRSFLGSLIFWMSCTIFRCLSESRMALLFVRGKFADTRTSNENLHLGKDLFTVFLCHLRIVQLFESEFLNDDTSATTKQLNVDYLPCHPTLSELCWWLQNFLCQYLTLAYTSPALLRRHIQNWKRHQQIVEEPPCWPRSPRNGRMVEIPCRGLVKFGYLGI